MRDLLDFLGSSPVTASVSSRAPPLAGTVRLTQSGVSAGLWHVFRRRNAKQAFQQRSEGRRIGASLRASPCSLRPGADHATAEPPAGATDSELSEFYYRRAEARNELGQDPGNKAAGEDAWKRTLAFLRANGV
jgi:hypothetical protein